MDIPIFYDILYIIRTVAEVSLFCVAIMALKTYMRRL